MKHPSLKTINDKKKKQINLLLIDKEGEKEAKKK